MNMYKKFLVYVSSTGCVIVTLIIIWWAVQKVIIYKQEREQPRK